MSSVAPESVQFDVESCPPSVPAKETLIVCSPSPQQDLQQSFERLSLSFEGVDLHSTMAPPNSPVRSNPSTPGVSDFGDIENSRSLPKSTNRYRYRPYHVPQSPCSSISRSSFEDYQNSARHRQFAASDTTLEGDVEDLRLTLVEENSLADPSDPQSGNQAKNNSCSVEAMRSGTSSEDGVYADVDELADYLNHFVYVRLKLSPQVESLYS